jgi:hypothetical protein
MTVAAVKAQAKTGPAPVKATATPPPAAPSRRRNFTPLTPMRRETAQRMRKLAAQVQESHPDLIVHQHLRDAARTLESGNEEGAERHLRAAIGKLTPQQLMKNGMHTDDLHIGAKQAMDGVHRHLLLVKDIADVAAKNQAAIRRDSYDDDSSSPPPVTSPVRADPNAGYGPGALAQKPTARQPPGNQALNAPARSSSGGSDPAVADPVGVQPRGSKQFTYGWNDLSAVIELASRPKVVELVGPKGYIHGWVYVGGPGLPSVASHNAKLQAKGITPPTKAHPALTREPPAAKAKAAAPEAAAKAPVKAAGKAPAAPSQAPAVKQAAVPSVPAKTTAPMSADEAAAAAAGTNAEKQAEGIKALGRIGGKSTQLAVIKKKSTDDLRAADYGFQQQAAATSNPKVTAAHQMVRDEITKRGGKLADLTAPVRVQSAAEVAQREKKALVVAWSSSYRYKGTSEVANNKRIADFAVEMRRLLSTNKQPKTCGPGCQDAHKFLSMVDKEATVQPGELQRGLTLTPAAAERMFKPGKSLDMPTASWTADPEVGASYAKGEGTPGKVKVLIHAAPGAKGMDISSLSNWHASEKGAGGENETVTGGRMNVDKVETVNGVMNVYVTQQAFSAH